MTEEKFFDTDESTENKSFNKPNYFRFSYGQHLVRILGAPLKVYTHWLNGKASVKCLGDEECPICKSNEVIKAENPDSFWKVPGWVAKQERHYMNVLDRTPVKVCPNCQAENKKDPTGKYSTACYNCETFITEVEPVSSGKVKVANISKRNANEINAYNKSILDENGTPLGVNNFDIMFFVTKGKRKDITPSPVPTRKDKVEVPEDALFDLETAILELNADEIVSLQKGVALRDILVARSEVSDDLVPEVKLADEAVVAVDEQLKEMFDL